MCMIAGKGCTGGEEEKYTCDLCGLVVCCKNCYLNYYKKEGLTCQRTGACKELAGEIKARRVLAKKLDAETKAEELRQKGLAKVKSELGDELFDRASQLSERFPDSEVAVAECPLALVRSAAEVKVLVQAGLAADWVKDNIAGANADQMFSIFARAFQKNTRVVLGGSRIRGYFAKTSEAHNYKEGEVPYKETSDLDIGYNLAGPRAKGLTDLAINEGNGKENWLPIESAVIAPGNTIGGKTIVSPEEFFQRNGERAEFDQKRVLENQTRYYASGSISFHPSGERSEYPPA